MIWKSPLPTEYVNNKSDNLWIVNWNLESLFTTLTCMNSLGSCISTFSRYRKGNPKTELGTLLIFTFDHFALWKYLNLSHSAKCSVSTQYIQNTIQCKFQSVQQGELCKYLSTLKTDNFANLVILTNFGFCLKPRLIKNTTLYPV